MKIRPIIALAAVMAIPGIASARQLHLTTKGNSLILEATKGQPLKILYYGTRLNDADAAGINEAGAINREAYPVYGLRPEHETAMSVTHPDGNKTLDLEVTDVSERQENGQTVTTVTMSDKVYPFLVNVNYRTFPENDIIETWTEAINNGKGTVRLDRFDSGYLPVRHNDVWLSSFYGSWANEARLDQSPLTHGVKIIKNKDGVRNTQTAHSEIMLSLDGEPRENEGQVIGAALEYPGNYQIRIDTDDSNFHHVFAGINPDNSEYYLDKGETFTTPPLALSFSNEGLGGISRNFHRWGRKHRLAHGDRERKILLNSWEGVYMDITEPGMQQMMRDIASFGGELFVMDDGWFGTGYKRTNDTRGLGDWIVDTDKLPNGIQGLLNSADSAGVKFGIWYEPEMANTTSVLYEKHPDWIIHSKGRPVMQGRGGTQVVLDMSNPRVQDHVFNMIDTLLTRYPAIDYIKWDANAPVMEHGSQYLPKDRQSHLYIEYHKGLAKTLDRIRAKYPDVTIQACASGGGRVNWGILPWFDEFWTSDNTDALQRVFMQWGTSYFFPAIAMGSHISTTPNHQTYRTTPIKFRCDVAMSGRLGMEIQPQKMTEEEKSVSRQAISDYKKIRPIVQFGDLYRLHSPYAVKGLHNILGAAGTDRVASLMYVTPGKDQAAFFWYKLDTYHNQQLPRIRMAGLDPGRIYRISELNRIDRKPLPFEGKTFSGAFLMDNGLEMPASHNVDHGKRSDYASRVLHLVAE